MYEVVFPGGIFVLISILRAALLVVLFGFSAKGFAAAPTVVTVAASGITSSSAVLNGSGNPGGEATTGRFRYSATNPGTCNDTFGTRVPATSGTDLGNGSATVPYSITTTGLTPGTTYYFCAIVTNASGTAYGSVLSFTIPAQPLVTTSAATSITSNSATINGTANPFTLSTSGWFRYSTTNPVTCDDSFGSRIPSSGGQNLGTGITPYAYAQSLTSLSPGTTYYFCAIAQNSLGTSVGTVQSFTTPSMAPTVSTNSASNLSRTGAQLNGYANPGGDATTAWFRYGPASPGTCNDTWGTRTPATGGTSLGSGTSNASFSQTVSGLLPGVTYYYCALAKNSQGLSWGSVQTFITPSAPTATTVFATYITNTTAQLNGLGNPNRAATSGWFRYALTDPGTCDDKFGSRAPLSGGTALGSDIYDQSYSQAISGLSPATTYYYCAIVQSSEGTAYGTILTFTTATVPVATTNPATGISATTATLNGAGNPNAATASGWFRYSASNPGSCNDSFGTRTPSSGGTNLGSGAASMPFTYSLSGLTPGTTYYYCAIVSNTYGNAYGTVQTFATPANAPTVTTSGAYNLSRTSATLSGYGNPGGDATTGWFRYSTASPGTCNDSFGTRAPATGGTALGSGTSNVTFTQAITGLAPATTYYFCAIVQNSGGQVVGSVQSFITPSAPTAATASATNLTTSSAQLNGSGNPNRASATGWFRYSIANPGTCDDKFGSRSPLTGGTALGNDIYDQTFAQSISGLSGGTTYYYCAIVQSSEGTAFGTVMSFTTSGIASATTNAASAVTSTTATLNGSGVPNGATASGWFRYSTTNPGTCNDSFGNRAPSSGGTNLGAGTTSSPFAQTISGLSPGATYYYCAIVSNTYGTGYGAVVQFTPLTMAPTVNTSGASSLTRTGAVLSGYANPGGDATTGWFRYSTASPGTCNDSFGTRAPAMGGSALGSGNTNVSFTQTISGLAPATTYYYCALAQNSLGMAMGSVQTFITPSAPTALTAAASNITDTTVLLNGSGNPNRAYTTGWFRYATTNPGACDDKFGSRAPVTGGTNLGSDIYDQPYNQTLSGLSPATTYYYCAIVQSSEGTAFGALLSFTTATAPTATTNPATSITSTSAILNGSGTPNGGTSTGWFRYSATNPGSCSDSFGTRAPSSGGTNLGAGTSATNFQQGIGSLSPGTTYYYCAIVTNSYGTSFGAIVSFVTPATTPTVSTSGASNLTRTDALLSGYGNPGGSATVGWFRYSTASPGTCNDSFGTRAPATGGSAMGAGTSNVSFSQAISGLSAATTYYYCAIAQNAQGIVFGSIQSFITPSAPSALTTAAGTIYDTSAQLNGSGNPNRAYTTGWFRYAATNPGTCDDKFGSRAPLSGGTNLGSDIYDQPYYQTVSGLSPATTYYYCAIVQSSEGTAFGAVMSFTTASPAVAVTGMPASVTSTSAMLSGTGTPNGGSTTGWFRYSATNPGACNDSFGSRIPSSGGTNLGAGFSPTSFAQSIGSLLPGTKYYYCAIAQNSYGIGYGAVVSFTTPVQAPAVTTSGASNLTRTTGVLYGYANPGGDATTGWFRYSTASPGTCNDTFGTRAPAMGGSPLGSGTSNVTFSQAITGLAPATTYYFCAIAQNSQGVAWGTVQTFITPTAPTALTTPATTITTSSAQLNGSGNPNRGATIGYFRYAATDPGTCDDKFGSRAPTSGGINLGSDIYDQPYYQSISGLSPATTYYFCAIVQSSEGTAFGTVLTFTTSAPATAATVAATSVTPTTATLNGSGNPNGATATGWFRYSTSSPGTCNDTFGTRTPTSGGISLGAGISTVPFGQLITGLSPGVTYYYCAIVQNAYGTGMGALLSVTTPAGPPTVSTDYPSGIATTLNGTANPNGSATTGWFRLATSSPGTCNDTFGTRIPTTGGTALGSGVVGVSYSNAATGLTPGTTYYYCAIAQNAVGTAFGTIRSFVAPMPPTVNTLAATPVTATTAQLNGTANPNGNSTIGWFRYSTSSPGTCNDVFGTRAPTSGGTSLGAGSSATPFGESISGLSPGTTYYFCAIAVSAYGTVFGSVLSFTTPTTLRTPIKPSAPGGTTPPITPTPSDVDLLAQRIVTLDATSIGTQTAILVGSANPSSEEMTGWFRLSSRDPGTCNDNFGIRGPQKGGAAVGASKIPVSFTQAMSGLSAGTTYYYCAIGSTDKGHFFGAVKQFTTRAAAPKVTTSAPTDVTAQMAQVHAAIVPSGDDTVAWFRYSAEPQESCNDSFGKRVPEHNQQSVGSGSREVVISETLYGLQRGTTYYVCAIAQNSHGTTLGELVQVVPGERAPEVETENPAAVDSATATLAGRVREHQGGSRTWFRLGEQNPAVCDDSFGIRVEARSLVVPSATSNLRFDTTPQPGDDTYRTSEPLTGLTPGTTYYYCAAASGVGGVTFGAVRSFTTALPPPEVGTVTMSAQTAEGTVGCSVGGTASSRGSVPAVLALLPLIGLLAARRRARRR